MEKNNLNEMKDNIFKCMGCGICRGIWEKKDEAMCPVWATGQGFEDSAPSGRVTVAQDILDGFLSYSQSLAESVYRCTNCGSCATICDSFDPETGKAIIDVPNIVIAMRMDLVENSLVPPQVRDYFNAIAVSGNPYKKPKTKRASWAEGTGIPIFSGQEYLFYVGDVGSFDECGIEMARSVATLLTKSGVKIGTMGERELSDGNDVNALGEKGLFQFLAEKNIAMFKDAGVKKIISLDPHSFNTFRNDYPVMGGNFEVWHYSQILLELINDGKILLPKFNAKVTYHDPCYLGRHNQIYEPPREILRRIPGLKLVEMKQSGKNSFCCGGGGGNFFTDLIGGEINSPSRIRVRQAIETGAEILAVACPLCLKMLDDAIKAETREEEIIAKDISEIVLGVNKGKVI